MTGEQRVRQRPEAHQAPAHRAARQEERRDTARHDDVGHRWSAAVEEGGCFGHRPNIGIGCGAGYRPPDEAAEGRIPVTSDGGMGSAGALTGLGLTVPSDTGLSLFVRARDSRPLAIPAQAITG